MARLRLELNNSGAWKLLGTFEEGPAAAMILARAAALADALNDPASGRSAIVSLRVATDEPLPRAALRYDTGGTWRVLQPRSQD